MRAVQLLDADVRGDDGGEARDGGGLPAVGDRRELCGGKAGDVGDVGQAEARAECVKEGRVLVGGERELAADGGVHGSPGRVFYMRAVYRVL